jgi:dihydroxy-acid dehydratase
MAALQQLLQHDRRAAWTPARSRRLSGTLEKYAAVVGQANLGAVTHSGNQSWNPEG